MNENVLRLRPVSLLTPLFRQQLINLLARNPILAKEHLQMKLLLPVHYPPVQAGLDYCADITITPHHNLRW